MLPNRLYFHQGIVFKTRPTTDKRPVIAEPRSRKIEPTTSATTAGKRKQTAQLVSG